MSVQWISEDKRMNVKYTPYAVYTVHPPHCSEHMYINVNIKPFVLNCKIVVLHVHKYSVQH